MRFLKQVRFRTPESVELEFTLAGVGSRALALVLDYVLWWLILILLAIMGAYIAEPLTNALSSLLSLRGRTIEIWLRSIAILIFFVIYVGYFVYFELSWQGQTPGKKFARIRVVDDTGRPPNLQQATLRSLLRPIDDILFIGFFAIAIGKHEKRLGDMVAGTIVTREYSDGRATAITTSAEAKSLAPELLKARNFAALTPKEFALAREYLQRRQDMFPQARIETCRQLAVELKETIALAEIPDGVTATQFLEAIYLAYQQNSPQPEAG